MANQDPSGFSAAVLDEMGVPVNDQTVQVMNAMQMAEGQWTAGGQWNAASDFNPFNISGGQSVASQYNLGVSAAKTQDPGNGPPVDVFAGWKAGVTATANFLKNADPGIFQSLQQLGKSGSPQDVSNFWNAVGASGSFGQDATTGPKLMDANLGSTTPVTTGTQTDVPGVPGNQPAATPAPTQITPGTTSAITGTGAAIPQLPGNATWPETEAYIKKNFPTYGWLLNIKGPDSPATVIQQAVTQGWDATQVQAHISQTNWWKDTSTALQQWQQNTATHPGEYDFNTKGSTAQQTLGQIEDAAKSVGAQLPEGIAKNLATEAMMYGWNPTQVKENIGSVISTGTAQQYSTSYLSGVEANPGQYEINGKTGTGPVAASAITQVRNSIAGQGYNPADFTNEDVQNLATEYMKFGWTSQQLAAAVVKVGAGGTAYQLSPSYTQGQITNPEQYEINGKNGTGPVASQALTTVRNAIASAGKTIGGKGGITAQQVQELAQESMMFGWNGQQLTQNIDSIGKGGGLLSPAYLQGILTNAQEYQPGGQAYVQAQTAVTQALAGAGRTGLGKDATNALIQAYMEQGWQQDPGKLTLAIGQTQGAGALSPSYLTGMQANPQQYQPGGVAYKAAQAAVKAAVAGAGKSVPAAAQDALVQQYMQQGWTEGSPQLTQAIGTATGGAGYATSYTTGMQQNPEQFQPGGVTYKAAQAAVKAAVAGAGKTVPAGVVEALVQQYMQQGWTEGSPQLTQAIGTAAGGAGYTQQYLTGLQANPQQYQSGGTAYVQAQNDIEAALRSNNVAPGAITQDEMNTLLSGVMQQGWDPTTLSNEIGALAHKGTPYNQQYLTGLASNPLEYQFTNPSQNKGVQTTADQVLTQVEIVAGNQGVNLTPSQAHDVAVKAMQSGGNNPPESMIQSMLAQYVSVAQNPAQQAQQPISANAATSPAGQGAPLAPTVANPGLGAQTNAPALLQQLRTQATNYLVTLPDSVYQQWAQQIAGGTQTMQAYEAYLAQQAGERYPGMQQQIQQGQTPTQVAGGLTQLASSTLEIQPDQVNYLNPQFAKLLTGGYTEGPGQTKIPNNAMMTQTQAGEYLRGLPQFAYTTNAQGDAASLETAILSAFGRVG